MKVKIYHKDGLGSRPEVDHLVFLDCLPGSNDQVIVKGRYWDVSSVIVNTDDNSAVIYVVENKNK